MHLGMYVDETCNVTFRLEGATTHAHSATEQDTNIETKMFYEITSTNLSFC
jgi:hypothetical protein